MIQPGSPSNANHYQAKTHAKHWYLNVLCCVAERCSVSANKPAAKPPTAPQKSWVSHKHAGAHTHTQTEFLTCCCVGLEVKLSLTLGWKFTAGRRKKKIVRIRARKCCYINLMWARSILQHLWLQPTPLHSELCSRIHGRVEIGRAQILACKSASRPGFLSCARPKRAPWLWFINWQRAKHLPPPEWWFIFAVIAQELMCFLLRFKQMSKSKAKVITSTGQGWTSLWHWNIFLQNKKKTLSRPMFDSKTKGEARIVSARGEMDSDTTDYSHEY